MLPSDGLEAFHAVARARSFSRAARELHISQSAVSQRILNLESTLSTALFIRGRSGVQLTAAGEELLRYCRTQASLEEELLGRLASPGSGKSPSLSGRLRVAGFSSVLRPVVLPALAHLLRAHPALQLEVRCGEMRELFAMLLSAEVDYVFLDDRRVRPGIESLFVGEEESVLVESDEFPTLPFYLDHDPDDVTTERFLELQGPDSGFARHPRIYLDDIFGIMDGVREGLGRAVVPSHLLRGAPGVRRVSGGTPLRTPIWLHFQTLPYETELHRRTVETLGRYIPDLLKS